ncbi:type VI secretion protein, VC_A0107 family [Escherichia coli STEC_DG131-3]|nr:type VI secretion protein, VC_A0107 family [Escherichia coli STEC_DG131-3]
MELPLKLLVAGDFSNGQEERPLSERIKMDVNKITLMLFWLISRRQYA